MLNTPFPPWPSYSEEEVEAVARVLQSNRVNYWTGEECLAFEREFANWAGTRHAVALANGTVALDAALRAIGVGPGDEVVVTPRTFIASASCIALVGATPVFADVDRDTQNISAETIRPVLTDRTKAIMAVHIAGLPCDMDPIMALAQERRLMVVEDCAQAHGARYRDRSVGSIGHIGAWSFCQDKIMTTGGEGGMVTTSDEELWSRMWSYKDHGRNWAATQERVHSPGFRWISESFGTNGRMIEIQAVIGRIQLRRLSDWTKARRANAERIWAAARDLPGLRVPVIPAWAEHAAYRAYVFVQPEALASGWDRNRVIAEIKALGVPCFVGTCPEVYLEKAFDGTGWRPMERLPVARELGERGLAFLVQPTLTERDIDKTCEAMATVIGMAAR